MCMLRITIVPWPSFTWQGSRSSVCVCVCMKQNCKVTALDRYRYTGTGLRRWSSCLLHMHLGNFLKSRNGETILYDLYVHIFSFCHFLLDLIRYLIVKLENKLRMINCISVLKTWKEHIQSIYLSMRIFKLCDKGASTTVRGFFLFWIVWHFSYYIF